MTGCQVIYRGQRHQFNDLEKAQNFIDELPLPRGEMKILGAPKLFELLNQIGAPICNWREINQEICHEWSGLFRDEAIDSNWYEKESHRISLLQTFKAVMDIAESTVLPEDLEIVRNAREKQYKTFIYQESMVGENVCVETLYAITQREIDAGRMSTDHSCRRLAEEAMAMPHSTRAELLGATNEKRQPQSDRNEKIVNKFLKWIRSIS